MNRRSIFAGLVGLLSMFLFRKTKAATPVEPNAPVDVCPKHPHHTQIRMTKPLNNPIFKDTALAQPRPYRSGRLYLVSTEVRLPTELLDGEMVCAECALELLRKYPNEVTRLTPTDHRLKSL